MEFEKGLSKEVQNTDIRVGAGINVKGIYPYINDFIFKTSEICVKSN
jgi:hypothetical protein